MYRIYWNQAAASYLSLISLVFFFSSFQTFKFFVALFSKTVRPVKLTVGTHVDNGWMYRVYSGVSLELSDREKFCDIFRTLGRSFGPNFGFHYMFYTFSLLTQPKIGRSQQG